jgi:hypothetical protein
MDILSVRRFRDILKEQAFLGVVEIKKIKREVQAEFIFRTASSKTRKSFARRSSRTAGCRTGLASSFFPHIGAPQDENRGMA